MGVIKLDEVGYEPKYYPRANGREDWMTVHRYADALKANPNEPFPPIHVVRATAKQYRYLILDGLNRTRAHAQAGLGEIRATVETLPESKWFARSVELNATHGRAFDVGDKAWVAKRLEEDGYSTEDAAKLLRMSVDSLTKIMVERIVKVSGTVRKDAPVSRASREACGQMFGFLKAPFKDHAGLKSAVAVLETQGPVNSKSVLNILDSMIALLEAGIDMADADVAERVVKIKRMLRQASPVKI